MQHIQYITSFIALCGLVGVSIYSVNHEDTIKMEIAAKAGLIQCREESFVLWKKECNK
jgi:hypothetical protein